MSPLCNSWPVFTERALRFMRDTVISPRTCSTAKQKEVREEYPHGKATIEARICENLSGASMVVDLPNCFFLDLLLFSWTSETSLCPGVAALGLAPAVRPLLPSKPSIRSCPSSCTSKREWLRQLELARISCQFVAKKQLPSRKASCGKTKYAVLLCVIRVRPVWYFS